MVGIPHHLCIHTFCLYQDNYLLPSQTDFKCIWGQEYPSSDFNVLNLYVEHAVFLQNSFCVIFFTWKNLKVKTEFDLQV